jgi:hypothetical protein
MDSLTLVSRSIPTPTIKPREYVEYPIGSTCVWFDLEGIADDGMGYTVSIHANGDVATQSRSNRHKIQEAFLGRSARSSPGESTPTGSEETGHIVRRESIQVQENYADKGLGGEVKTWNPISTEPAVERIQLSNFSSTPTPTRNIPTPLGESRRLDEPPRSVSRQIASRLSSRRRNPANPVNTSQNLPQSMYFSD